MHEASRPEERAFVVHRALCVLALIGSSAAWFYGCSSCDTDSTVPFKRGSSGQTRSTGLPDAGLPAPAETAVPAREGQRYAEGTRRIEIGGLAFAAPEGEIRAALEIVLDGAPALLVLMTDAKGQLLLAHTQRMKNAWAVTSQVAVLDGGAHCRPTGGGVQALDTSYAVANADFDCDAIAKTNAAAQPEAEPQPVALRERHQWIATLERAPRVLEHLSTPLAPGAVEASLQSRDLDADASPDLLLALKVPTAQGDVRIELKLLDRAGGLARDTSEPETTLLVLADQAKAERRRSPERALALADQVLAVHRALCSEGGGATLRIGSQDGLTCGASLAGGRAASIRAAVLANQNKLLAAIDLYGQLSSAAYRLTENDWERARFALEAQVEKNSIVWRPIATVDVAAGPSVRRAAAAFIDEKHILLRGSTARSYDLDTALMEPTGIDGKSMFVDPSGQFAIASIFRSCQGYHLRIVHVAQIVGDIVAGGSAAEPLIMEAAPPNGGECKKLAAAQAKDEGGFRVLRWTQDGVLLGRGASLLRLTLDAKAAASAPAQAIEDSALVPSTEQSAELTADGRYHALLTPLGIAIHDRAQGSTRLVALPSAAGAARVTSLALSPSSRTLAVVRGDQLFVGAPGVPSEPSPPDPPAPP